MADILETGDRDDGGQMASSSEYLEYVLDLLSEVDGIESRNMMGGYVLYCRGKVIGGVYDDRFLIKPTASARRMLPDARMELPCEGTREMLLVDIEDHHRGVFLWFCQVGIPACSTAWAGARGESPSVTKGCGPRVPAP